MLRFLKALVKAATGTYYENNNTSSLITPTPPATFLALANEAESKNEEMSEALTVLQTVRETTPVFHLFRQPSTSLNNIYRLFQNNALQQLLIKAGHLSITPLPNLGFRVKLFGQVELARFGRLTNGKPAIKFGEQVMLLEDIQAPSVQLQRAVAPTTKASTGENISVFGRFVNRISTTGTNTLNAAIKFIFPDAPPATNTNTTTQKVKHNSWPLSAALPAWHPLKWLLESLPGAPHAKSRAPGSQPDPLTAIVSVNFPEQLSASREDIYQLLQNGPLLQQYLRDGRLKITRQPNILPNEPSSVYIIELAGYSKRARLIRLENGEQAFKMGFITIPLRDAPWALPFIPPIVVPLAETHLPPAETRLPSAETHLPPAETRLPPAETRLPPPDAPIMPRPADHIFTYKERLAELDSTIKTIVDPTIRQKAIAVKEKIIALYKRGDDSTKLAVYLDQTNRLITSAPGDARKAIAVEYKQLTISAQNCLDPLWQALGVALMLLGAAIAAVGVVSTVATGGIGIEAGAIVTVNGALLLAAGIGLFARGCRENASAVMADLNNSVFPIAPTP